MDVLEEMEKGNITGEKIKIAKSKYDRSDVVEALKRGFRIISTHFMIDSYLVEESESKETEKNSDYYHNLANDLSDGREIEYEGVKISK